MTKTKCVLSISLEQARSDVRIVKHLFDQYFSQPSLLLNSIQAQVELISGVIFDKYARWELIACTDENTFFISISPSDISVDELSIWHEIGYRASINVFGSLAEYSLEKLAIFEKFTKHFNIKYSTKVA